MVGHFPAFSANPIRTIRAGYDAMGPCFSMTFLGQPLTFLLGPSAHAPFFDARDEQLSQNEPYKFMTPIFGKGVVFDAPPAVKAQQLRFVSSALHNKALQTHVGWIVKETQDYFDKHWAGESGEVDLLEALAELTIATSSRCLLGREVREHLFEKVAGLLHTIDEGINPIAIFVPNLPLPVFACVRGAPLCGRGGSGGVAATAFEGGCRCV